MPIAARRRSLRPLVASMLGLGLAAAGREARAAQLGEVLATASFETAGLIVKVEGDSGNESVTVDVKGPGDADFRPAHGAVRFEPHAWGTSLFGLASGASYQVRVTLADPDGVSGQASQVIALQARAEAAPPAPKRVRWVGPAGQDSSGAGASKEAPYLTIAHALGQAGPGDEIRVLPGTYGPTAADGVHGTEGAPIVLRADDPSSRPVIDGQGSGSSLRLNDASWLVIDGLEIRNGGPDDSGQGVYLRASAHVTVRGCYIHDNGHDNVLISKGAEFSGGALAAGFHLIEDNDIADVDHEDCAGASNAACPGQTYYGVKLDNNPGGGTVVRRNRIRGHDDNVSPCGDEAAGRELRDSDPVLALVGAGPWTNHDLELHDNTLEDARDDGVELDGICVNARVYRNRVVGAQNAFSAAPAMPGPFFFVRNVATGAIVEGAFKLNTAGESDVPTRHLFVYHNDFVRSTKGTILNLWFAVEGDHNVPVHDVRFRNNVFTTPDGQALDASNQGAEQPSLDGDVWYTPSTGTQFSWWNGSKIDSYPSFAAWQSGAGVEPAGAFGEPGLDGDLRPTPGALVLDRAVPLPGINDRFAGTGPDVGAFELGDPGQGGAGSGGQAGSGAAGSGAAGGGAAGGGQAGGGVAGGGTAGRGAGGSGQPGGGAGGMAGKGGVPGSSGQSGAAGEGTSDEGSDDGCGCVAAGRSPQGGGLALLGLAALAAGRRRRR